MKRPEVEDEALQEMSREVAVHAVAFHLTVPRNLIDSFDDCLGVRLCVIMCICVCVCVFVFIYIYIYMCVCVWVFVCLFVCIRSFVCIFQCVCLYQRVVV